MSMRMRRAAGQDCTEIEAGLLRKKAHFHDIVVSFLSPRYRPRQYWLSSEKSTGGTLGEQEDDFTPLAM